MIRSLPGPRSGPGTGTFQVCFVCTGNICRSPMAEVVLRELARTTAIGPDRTLADILLVSSVGTGPWHAGEPMDPRARAALARRAYSGDAHVAQQVDRDVLGAADLVVCLDRRHLETLRGLAGDLEVEERFVMLRGFDPAAGGASDIADPYYGEARDFDECLANVEASCRGLASALARTLGAEPSP